MEMNDTIVLDTNAIISLFDSNRNIANMLGEENTVIVPAIVFAESLKQARKAKHVAAMRQ